MKLLAVLILIGSCGLTCANEKDKDEPMAYGLGAASCGAYLEARKQRGFDAALYLPYVTGFLTAINDTNSPGTTDILRDTDLDGALHWLDNYCRRQPTTTFADALGALVVHLRSNKNLDATS